MRLFKLELGSIKPKRLNSISEFLKLNLLSDKVWLAGGSLRTLVDFEDVVNDYDLFFQTVESQKETQGKLEVLGFEKIYECPDGFLFTYRKDCVKVQLICENTYSDFFALLSTFDFTACCAVTDGKLLYFTDDFVRSVRKKELHIANLPYPVATLKRIVKYSAKGYSISLAAKEFVEKLLESGGKEQNMRGYID